MLEHTLAWVNITPLGKPVVPLNNKDYDKLKVLFLIIINALLTLSRVTQRYLQKDRSE